MACCLYFKELELDGKSVPIITGVQSELLLKGTVVDQLRFAYKKYGSTFFMHN